MRIITLPISYLVYALLYIPALVKYTYLYMDRIEEDENKAQDKLTDYWEQFTSTVDAIVECLD